MLIFLQRNEWTKFMAGLCCIECIVDKKKKKREGESMGRMLDLAAFQGPKIKHLGASLFVLRYIQF